MSAPCNRSLSQLELLVWIDSHEKFEGVNDYIAFNRSKVKSYEFYHGVVGDPIDSHVVVEFHNKTDALLFKLAHG